MTPKEQAQARHEAKVREIAEEMAAVYFLPKSEPMRTTYIERFIPAARIAVKHMVSTAADSWEEGKLSWYKEIGELEEEEEAFFNLDAYLVDRGLVPTNESK